MSSDNPSPAPSANPADDVLDVAIWVDPVMLACESAFMRHLVMGLKADGHLVTFIAQQSLDLSLLPTLGSRCLTFRANRWERLPMIQRFRLQPVIDAFRSHPPDVLLVWGSCDLQQLELLTQFLHAVPMPTIAWCWDASEVFSPLMSSPHLRHIIAASDPIGERALARPNPAVPVTVIHPGVYIEDAINCFDVEGQVPCLVSLDPLSDRRQYEPFLRACRLLADHGVDYLLFAYDTGRDEYAIWQEAERLLLLDRLSFVPFQQDAEPLLLHGDLYLHILPASRVSYRTLEAMGRGLAPVAALNVAADYLLPHETARLVLDQTAEAWRDALGDLIANRAKTIGLARRAQQHVREHHSMIRTITQFTSLCRQVIGAPIAILGK